MAAIVGVAVCIMQTGLRRSILNPYLFVCLSYFTFFGFPLDDPEYALVVDLMHLLAFSCFTIAFFRAMTGPGHKITRLLRHIWPPLRNAGTSISPLSQRATIYLAFLAVAYAALDLWLNSLGYGGLSRALVRFYVLLPESVASLWLSRISTWLSRVSVVVVFALRLNYALYGRGRLAMWLALLTGLVVAFPTGSAGKFIQPVLVCVIADILAALHQNRSLRPHLDMVAVGTLAVCGAMLLHVIRGTPFESVSQVVGSVTQEREGMPDSLLSAATHAHGMVSEDTALCIRTFGRSEDFIPGHTLYTIIVNPIPREIWPSKPIAFGRVVGQIKRGEYGNPSAKAQGWSIAAGLAGEGYANGGYLGIIILSLLVGHLCGKAAKAARVGFCTRSYPILIISLLLYRLSIMFVRGDVHSAWTQTLYPLLLLTFAFAVWARLRRFLSVIGGTHPHEAPDGKKVLWPEG
jgi:hypothetical protein